MTDRSAITAELKDEKSRRVEFFSAATDVLSALDNIGYKVGRGKLGIRTLNQMNKSNFQILLADKEQVK